MALMTLLAALKGYGSGRLQAQAGDEKQQFLTMKQALDQAKLDQQAAYQNGQIGVRQTANGIRQQSVDNAGRYHDGLLDFRTASGLGGGTITPQDLAAARGIRNPDAQGIGYTTDTGAQAPALPPVAPPTPVVQAGPGQAPAAPGVAVIGTGPPTRITGTPALSPLIAPKAAAGIRKTLADTAYVTNAKTPNTKARTDFLTTQNDTLQAKLPYAGDLAYQQDQLAQTRAKDQPGLDTSLVGNRNAGAFLSRTMAGLKPQEFQQQKAYQDRTLQLRQQGLSQQAAEAQANHEVALMNAKTNSFRAHLPAASGAAKTSSAEMNQNNSLIAGYDKQKNAVILGAIDPKTGKGRALSQGEQDLVDRADTNISYYKQRNQQLQGGTAAVDPTTSPGYAVVPGQGRVPVPSVPVLPGFAPSHHSQAQPRHPQTKQFVAAPAARTVRTKSGVYSYTVK